MFSRSKLRTKLVLLLGLSACAVIVSVGIGAQMLHTCMVEDRVDKLRSVVQSTMAIAQALDKQVAEHRSRRSRPSASCERSFIRCASTGVPATFP